MPSVKKRIAFGKNLFWIAMASVLILSYAQPNLVIGQNSKLISNNLHEFAEPNHTYNSIEERLSQIITKSDSLVKVNEKSALRYFEKSIDTIQLEEVGNILLADYYHVYGKLLVENEMYDIGLKNLKRSLKLKIKIYGNKESRLAKTYNFIGIAHFGMHNYEDALDNYSKSVEILTLNSFYGRDLFNTYQNIGIVKANLGNFKDAYVYFKNASDIIDRGPATDSSSIARFYNNYGLLATFMGKMELANEYFEISETYYINLFGEQNLRLASLNLNKGVNTYTNLNYNLSNLYHNKAVELYLSNNKIGIGLIKSLSNLCAINRELGNVQASLDYGYQALSFNPPAEMKLLVYQNLVKTYQILKDYDKARKNLDKALQIVERQGFNPRQRFDLFITYANFLLYIKDYPQSYMFYKKALDIEGESNGYKTVKYAFVLSRLGFYYLEAEPGSNKALHYFKRSVEIWQNYTKSDGKGNVSESFHDIRFASAYRGKSKALIRKYEIEGTIGDMFESLRNYEWLLVQLERINRSLQKENQEIVRGKLYPIYNEAIELSYKLYKLTSNNYFQKKAFSFSEKSKSAILLSSIQNQNALKTSELPKELLQKDQNLNEEINAVKKQLFEEKQNTNPKRKRLNFFKNRLVQLLQSHDSLVRFLEKNYPKYYSLKYDLSIIGFDELSRKLTKDEALIEYQLFDSSLYIFVVRNKKLLTKKVIIDSSFFKSLNYFIALKNTDLTTQNRSDFNTFKQHSNNLFGYLIEPVYSEIKDKKLVIVPSGLLGYLPFELLIRPGNMVNELEYKRLNYLIKEFPISYTYSSTLRFSPFFNNSSYKTSLKMLFMAPDYSDNKSDSLLPQGEKLSKLPYAQVEVDELYAEYGGMAIKNEKALKSSFIKLAPNFDIIHMAMHTLINDSLPMYSKLVFSPDGYETKNMFLHTSEIYGLDLKASMVTLSACNTGAGVLQKGEGIMSLARGFVYAGVPSVVMTLWEVQDESGLQIMKKFYENLSLGMSKDEAMQLAKLDMLNSANMIKSHPNFWAAYIVTGDTAPLNIHDEKNNVWVLLFFVVIFVIIFIIYKRLVLDEDYY